MKRRNQFLAAGLIGLCGLSTGCSTQPQTAVQPALTATAATLPAPRAPLAVDVFEISPAAAPREQLIPAVISSDRTALLLAQREGVLTELRIQEGARVKQGQELARLSEDDLRAQLRQAQLEVERLLIEEQQYESLVKVNRTELAQEQTLFKDGLNSQRQLERAQYKVEESVHELDKIRLATRTAQAKVEAIKLETEKTIIRAPFNGLITHAYARLGSNIVRSDKLFEVSQTVPLEVKFQLPPTEMRTLRAGSMVRLSLPGDERVIASARITRFDPVADAVNNSIGIRAELLPNAGLLIGASVNVRLAQASTANVIWIPLTALPSRVIPPRHSSQQIFVADGSHCALRTVIVTEIEGDQVGISDGLQAGDRVILAPLAELKPGAPIVPKRL